MAGCPALSTGDAFLSTLLRHIDCQSQTLGSAGYQALADPTAPLSLALTAMLTIFIAVFGLKMILGDTPSLRDGVMAVVKIGVVLVIATSWPAYRIVIYDVIVSGPAQLSQAIGKQTGLPGTDNDLIARLQTSDVAMNRLITLGSGRNDLLSSPPALVNGSEPPPRTPIEDDPVLGAARIVFLSTTIAAFAIVRLMAGVLLALAPVFAGLLLFDISRGLFAGWLRALVFTLLASVAATILFGVQLALLEPWLTQVLQLRLAKVITAAAPIELLVICLAFAFALAGAFALLLRLAFTMQVPAGHAQMSFTSHQSDRSQPYQTATSRSDLDPSPSRAMAVAGAVMAAERRERVQMTSRASMTARNIGSTPSSHSAAEEFAIPTPGQTVRRTRPRKSLGAALRDRRT